MDGGRKAPINEHHVAHSPDTRTHLLDAFRRGEPAATDTLLQHYAPWLTLLARLQIESHFQGKFDPADLVQQALMEAYRDAAAFRGRTETEFMGWLRKILAHVFAHEVRRYRGTKKRDVSQEISLEHSLDESAHRLRDMLSASQTSPSQRAVRHEEEGRLAAVLAKLPEDYREVIILRNLQGLAHEEVARRMGRNTGAVRMLWTRALARLREEMLRTETGPGD